MNRLRISQTVSLFLLSQVFLIVSYKPLLLKLVDILLKSNKTIFELPEFVAPIETLEESLIQAVKAHNSDENESEINEHSMTSINDNNISQSLVENSDQITEPLNDSDLNSVEISMDTTSLTDEEKAKVTLNRSLFKANLTENKPFLESILSALDCDNQTDDRLPLFTLCLLYAVIHNSGIVLGLTELYQTITLSLRINNSIFSIRRK
jgi:protein CLEC16A